MKNDGLTDTNIYYNGVSVANYSSFDTFYFSQAVNNYYGLTYPFYFGGNLGLSFTIPNLDYGYTISFAIGNNLNYSSDYNYGYQNGYNDGYSKGLDDGNTKGYADGLSAGYQNGYATGYSDGLNTASQTSFSSLFGAIADTPIMFIRSLFNFDLFGMNVFIIIMSLLTGFIVIYIVKKVIK